MAATQRSSAASIIGFGPPSHGKVTESCDILATPRFKPGFSLGTFQTSSNNTDAMIQTPTIKNPLSKRVNKSFVG